MNVGDKVIVRGRWAENGSVYSGGEVVRATQAYVWVKTADEWHGDKGARYDRANVGPFDALKLSELRALEKQRAELNRQVYELSRREAELLKGSPVEAQG